MVEVPKKDKTNTIPDEAIFEINSRIVNTLESILPRRLFIGSLASLGVATTGAVTYFANQEPTGRPTFLNQSPKQATTTGTLGGWVAATFTAISGSLGIAGILNQPQTVSKDDLKSKNFPVGGDYLFEHRNELPEKLRIEIVLKYLKQRKQEASFEEAKALLQAFEKRQEAKYLAKIEKQKKYSKPADKYKSATGPILPISYSAPNNDKI